MSEEEVVQTPEQPVEAASAPAESTPSMEDPQAKNWKEVRAQLKQLKRENEHLAQELTKRTEKPAADEDADFRPDDLVDGKTARRMAEKLVEKRLGALQAEQESKLAELRLKNAYPDIESVVTDEAMEELKESDYALWKSVVKEKDMYDRGELAYKFVQQMKKSKEDPYAKERAKAEANLKKPSPAHAVKGSAGDGQESIFVNGLTPELKAKLYKEMKQAMQRVN